MTTNPNKISSEIEKITDYEMPTLGSISRCHFPHMEGVDPDSPARPKPRPALVVGIDPDTNMVIVIYGTTQRTGEDELYDTELVIRKTDQDFEFTGLAHDTKFNFERSVQLPYNSEYFSIPNPTRFKIYTNPRIGILPFSYESALKKAAFNAKEKEKK
ncbi:hypothetical protein [Pectobacterium versatile]|uniref:hypothetical protein n=1 Tax=Pectobacterium versatile TaxID=2488639 RepID=UPI00102EDD92|nr:hypothetical protein [Pectobacterium versatile]MBN3196329.1 hypothetical protein [Pectobacterium versatile]MBQ4783067.1 hypothetical protein [Pectobacterium versatile]MBQ4787539.1 hypothetical protein [Pectobacterium versatile]TAJ00515.1 hypothetical protein EG335_03870 [Pectobacterium versatile]